MRRILVEYARGKDRLKRGGQMERQDVDLAEIVSPVKREELLSIDAALEKLESRNSLAATLVKLRYFAGLTILEASDALGVSHATAERHWTFARAWLYSQLRDDS